MAQIPQIMPSQNYPGKWAVLIYIAGQPNIMEPYETLGEAQQVMNSNMPTEHFDTVQDQFNWNKYS